MAAVTSLAPSGSKRIGGLGLADGVVGGAAPTATPTVQNKQEKQVMMVGVVSIGTIHGCGTHGCPCPLALGDSPCHSYASGQDRP